MKHSFIRLITLVFIFSTLVSFGQDKLEKVDILWGSTQNESKKSTLEEIVGYDETGIYVIKTNEKGLYGMNSSIMLEHYNNQMDQSKSIKLKLPYQKKERKYKFIVQLNNELFIFSSFRNKKQNILFAQQIDKKSLNLNKNLKKIADIELSGKSNHDTWNYNYKISRDSSKVLIYYNIGFCRGESEQFGFYVLDKNLNQLWEKRVTLPYKEELFEVEDYDIDNNGNVHLLSLVYNDKRKEKRQGKPNYQYQILSYFNSGNDFKEYEIKIEGKFLTDMQIASNMKQDIICSGFYSDEGTFSIKGSYFIKIDGETKKITKQSFMEFGIDFITKHMTEKEELKTKKHDKKKNNVELFEYDLSHIVLREDGSAVLVGEQYYVRMIKQNSSPGGMSGVMTTAYYYYFNDIIVISISPNGVIEWAEKIHKRQVSTNDKGFYSSYALSVVNDKLYFIFNGKSKVIIYDENSIFYNLNQNNESEVVLVEIDIEGKKKRDALFSIREADVTIRPKVCKQISENEMILFGQRKKIHQFAKIAFKK